MRVVRSTTRCDLRLEEINPPLAFSVDFRGDNYRVVGDFFFVDITYRVRAFMKGTPGTTILNVNCKLETEFAFNNPRPSEKELRAFAEGNAIFSSWGFFREFVQSSIVRMGYPPPMVPFLRLGVKDSNESATTLAKPTRKPGGGKRKAK
jgi:hypothetical protein